MGTKTCPKEIPGEKKSSAQNGFFGKRDPRQQRQQGRKESGD